MNPICYRNRIDIITSILKIANGNEVKQVEILVKANITHTMFKEYLFHLFQSGLIEYIRFQRTYRTTTKGILFLSICDKMKNLIDLIVNFVYVSYYGQIVGLFEFSHIYELQ